MKLGTVAYCPPKNKLNSDAFFSNLQKFPAKHPLYLLSDDPGRNPSRVISNPENIGRRPHWALNNILWFEALSLARDVALDAFIYLESDSRVYGDGWDDAVFRDYEGRYPGGIACAGSLVAWDVNSGGKEFATKVIEKAFRYQEATGIPACFYSGKHPNDCSGGCFYPNGSGAVFDTKAMLAIFTGFDSDIPAYSKRHTAWDMCIGRFLWNYHGPKAVDYVGWLRKSYSGFGDCVVSYEERKNLLLSGQCSIVHQVKDDWTP